VTHKGANLAAFGLDVPQHEQEWMLAELRRARYGYLLALHVLLLCAAGRTPTEIATCLFCARSSGYRIVNTYKAQALDHLVNPLVPKAVWLSPSLCRSLLALLKKVPAAYGWCRTRWVIATLAANSRSSGESRSRLTMRRWLHRLGWVWKRAQLVARDDDRRRIESWPVSATRETPRNGQSCCFCDELDIHLLPKVGYQWMPQGETVKLVTPGQNQKHYMAGALELKTGRMVHCVGATQNERCSGRYWRIWKELLRRRGSIKSTWSWTTMAFTKPRRSSGGLNTAHQFKLLFLPTYCPKGDPIERAFGDIHDKCTRNHQRHRIEELVGDVAQHLATNGPWLYQLATMLHTPSDNRSGAHRLRTAFTAGGLSVPFLCRLV
jgi:putative transposase